MDCLDDNAVLDLVQGALSPEESAAAHLHLDGCVLCQRLVGELTRAERPAAPRAPGPGDVLGHYRLLEPVGRGGMGVVYAAEDVQLGRKVALKLLRLDAQGGSAAGARRHLLAEAQALARLSHPHVVTVFEAGEVGETVYVAMELVEGCTLREWLQQRRRPWREVLGAFLQAGEGLAAAHAAGLVHRDFKPDNVLVRQDGRIQVGDFGLALPPGARLEGEGAHTLSGTPAYMAPEQLAGAQVDARADQFSFCLALYEGLYGERPFSGDSLRERAAAVREGRVRPAPRGAQVPWWLRRLVLRGLSAAPDARFDTLVQLLGRLRRGLRAASTRLQAVAGLVLVVAGAAVGALPGRGEDAVCSGAEGRLAGVWDEGRKEAVRQALLGAATPYAQDAWRGVERALDGYTEAWKAQHTEACEATRLRAEQSEALLDLRMGCLDRRLQDVSALTGFFLRARGEALEQAVQAAWALPPLQECAASEVLAARVAAPTDAKARAQVEALTARMSEVRVLDSAGRYTEALALAQQAADEARAVEHLPTRAEALHLLGGLRRRNGEAHAAEKALSEAVWAAEAGRHDRLVARARIDLVGVVGNLQLRPESTGLYAREAEAALARIAPAPELESELATTVAAALTEQDRCDEAVVQLRRALVLDAGTLRPEDPHRGLVLTRLGNALACLGALDEALAHQREALALYERLLGPEHPAVSTAHNNLANALHLKGDYEGALEHHRRGLALRERGQGAESASTVIALCNIATDLNALGRSEEALALATRALRTWEGVLGPDSPRLALALITLGETQVRLGQRDEARATLTRSLALLQGRDDEQVAAARFALAQALGDTRAERREARALVEQAQAYYSRRPRRYRVELGRIAEWRAARP